MDTEQTDPEHHHQHGDRSVGVLSTENCEFISAGTNPVGHPSSIGRSANWEVARLLTEKMLVRLQPCQQMSR